MAQTIITGGELFGEASIELVRDEASGEPRLLLWDGVTELVAPSAQYRTLNYQPSSLSPSLLRELNLPTHCTLPGVTRDLLDDICRLIAKFVGLPERLVSIVGRFTLLTWIVESVQVAPGLALVGPNTHSGNQLLNLLHCVCRHPLRIGGVTPARLCSLPSGMGFTLEISQMEINDKLWAFLDDASVRNYKIPHRGELLDLRGCQIIRTEELPDSEASAARFVQIPMVAGRQQLPALDPATQDHISREFQPRLLGFRRSKLGDAGQARFDASTFDVSTLVCSLHGLAESLAAATPDDAALSAEVINLLQQQDIDIRSARWMDLGTIVVEAVLVLCHEAKDLVYVSEVAEIAGEIWSRRGGATQVDPGAVGKRLKRLGFATEQRDAGGVRLRLTPAVCEHARRIANEFGVPKQGPAIEAADQKV